jgi:hypothetical protein
MSNSLRDKLLGLGFTEAPKTPKAPARQRPESRHGQPPNGARPGRPQARGAQPGNPPRKDPVRDAGKRAAGGQGGKRNPAPDARAPRTREDIDLAKARLAEFLAGKSLNAADAEHVRHFEYGGKIKRIHVTADQLQALNAGALGVVQLDGRYLLVDAATLARAGEIFAPAVALQVDPHAPPQDDPYADPRYQVPDDLVW